MTDHERLRAFAQGLIDEADQVVDQCGVSGANYELAQAAAARRLLALLDSLPPIDAPDRIPPLMLEELQAYRDGGVPPGSFLRAVLAGDLLAAMATADEASMLALPAVVAWIRRELSPAAYGSADVVHRWTRRARS